MKEEIQELKQDEERKRKIEEWIVHTNNYIKQKTKERKEAKI